MTEHRLTKAEISSKQPEVVSGIDRGYIRSNPDKVRGLLARSLTEGGVVLDASAEPSDVLNRIIDLTTHFGATTLRTGQRQNFEDDTTAFVEEYRTQTAIALPTDPNTLSHRLFIEMVGPLDITQLPPRPEEVLTPIGSILPKPTVEISFRKRNRDDTEEGHKRDWLP